MQKVEGSSPFSRLESPPNRTQKVLSSSARRPVPKGPAPGLLSSGPPSSRPGFNRGLLRLVDDWLTQPRRCRSDRRPRPAPCATGSTGEARRPPSAPHQLHPDLAQPPDRGPRRRQTGRAADARRPPARGPTHGRARVPRGHMMVTQQLHATATHRDDRSIPSACRMTTWPASNPRPSAVSPRRRVGS
jgi:hypothetical protein